MIYRDDSLNEAYVILKRGYDYSLKNELNHLKDHAPFLYDMLTGNERDINYSWELYHIELDKFYGKLEKIRIDRNLIDIVLSGPALDLIYKPINEMIEEHRLYDKAAYEKNWNLKPIEENKLPIIIYNEITGIGTVNGNNFRFARGRKGGMMFRLFARLYKRMNQSINRFDVLEAISFYESGQESDSNNSTLETKAITNVVSKIRDKTGLNQQELVVNNGDVTLVGRKA